MTAFVVIALVAAACRGRPPKSAAACDDGAKVHPFDASAQGGTTDVGDAGDGRDAGDARDAGDGRDLRDMRMASDAGVALSDAAAARPDFGIVWPKPDPEKQGDAQRALESARKKYETCRNYRDRGTLVEAFWQNPGDRTAWVAHFDTLFVRDKGLRFRFFDESGKMKFAIWRRGEKTIHYDFGRSEEMPYEQALYALMGVTRQVSSLVPALLYRTQHGGRQEICTPQFLGVSFTCGSPHCERILMECGRAESQDVLVIDEARASGASGGAGVIRRRESMFISRPGPEWELPQHATEDLTTYEPEFDIADAAPLIKELDKQPW
jgi:hypothetical protein